MLCWMSRSTKSEVFRRGLEVAVEESPCCRLSPDCKSDLLALILVRSRTRRSQLGLSVVRVPSP